MIQSIHFNLAKNETLISIPKEGLDHLPCPTGKYCGYGILNGTMSVTGIS